MVVFDRNILTVVSLPGDGHFGITGTSLENSKEDEGFRTTGF